MQNVEIGDQGVCHPRKVDGHTWWRIEERVSLDHREIVTKIIPESEH